MPLALKLYRSYNLFMPESMRVDCLRPKQKVHIHGMVKVVARIDHHSGRVQIEFTDGGVSRWLWENTRILLAK